MSLNPIDIEQKTFRVALRGYAEEEVDAFLDEIVASLRTAEDKLHEAQAQVKELEQRLSATQESEDRIKRILVIAQKTADEVVREARFEAQQILSEARLDASEIETEQARRRERLGSEVGMLQGVVGELRSHVRGLSDRLMAQVEDVEIAMSNAVPDEFKEPVEEEEEFETVYEADESPADEFPADEFPAEDDSTSDDGEWHHAATEDLDEESNTSAAVDAEEEKVDDSDQPDTGEVYLGSDRRPWERYGD